MQADFRDVVAEYLRLLSTRDPLRSCLCVSHVHKDRKKGRIDVGEMNPNDGVLPSLFRGIAYRTG
jgi:hypothetical protein